MGLKEDLKEMSMRLGADLFGVTSADSLNDAPLGTALRIFYRMQSPLLFLG